MMVLLIILFFVRILCSLIERPLLAVGLLLLALRREEGLSRELQFDPY